MKDSSSSKLHQAITEFRKEKKRYAFIVYYEPRMQNPDHPPAFSPTARRLFRSHPFCVRPFTQLTALMRTIGLLDDTSQAKADEYLRTHPIRPRDCANADGSRNPTAQSSANGRAIEQTIIEMCKYVGLAAHEAIRFGCKGAQENGQPLPYKWDIAITTDQTELWIESKGQFKKGSTSDKIGATIGAVEMIISQFFDNERLLTD